MTTQELLCYQMNPMEVQVWLELCDIIRAKFASLSIPAVALAELKKRLSPGTPYTYAMGYTESDGYFYVEAGDRGNSYMVFKTSSREEAENQMLKRLAHEVSYKYVVSNMEQIERKHRVDWRFYNVVDGREPGRVLSHDEENETWKYDATYDYRKYWFEMALGILRETASTELFQAEVQNYEKLLNRRFNEAFWRFDVERLEFVCA